MWQASTVLDLLSAAAPAPRILCCSLWPCRFNFKSHVQFFSLRKVPRFTVRLNYAVPGRWNMLSTRIVIHACLQAPKVLSTRVNRLSRAVSLERHILRARCLWKQEMPRMNSLLTPYLDTS